MNIYYILAGSLTLIMEIAHTIWGNKFILSDLQKSNIKESGKTGFFIAWHQITATLAISGLALILLGAGIRSKSANAIALLITIITSVNFFVFICTCLQKNKSLIKESIPQIIFFTLIIGLTITGILH